jgi:hypothetical protein
MGNLKSAGSFIGANGSMLLLGGRKSEADDSAAINAVQLRCLARICADPSGPRVNGASSRTLPVLARCLMEQEQMDTEAVHGTNHVNMVIKVEMPLWCGNPEPRPISNHRMGE